MIQSDNDTREAIMNITLDFRSDIPIYIQIVEQVRQQIADGRLKPGDQLPTVRSLASDLRINFNTVSRAYRLLDEAGVISTQQGRGTYILDMPPPEVAEHLRIESITALARRYLGETRRLGFSLEQAIDHLRQQASLPNNETPDLE
jgi:GntR family transcriptional regulator